MRLHLGVDKLDKRFLTVLDDIAEIAAIREVGRDIPIRRGVQNYRFRLPINS